MEGCSSAKALYHVDHSLYTYKATTAFRAVGISPTNNSSVYMGNWLKFPNPCGSDVMLLGSENPSTGERICMAVGDIEEVKQKIGLSDNGKPVSAPSDGRMSVEQVVVPLNRNLLLDSYEPCLDAMGSAEIDWKCIPGPVRGQVVKLIGVEVNKYKEELAVIISLENGKIMSEARGEIQEFIDICDLAVGISRQLEGKVIASERVGHLLLENYHPLGRVGVITAFNFPVAVFGWNLAIALVCGNCVLWKPSDTTPLTSIALINIIHRALDPHYKTSLPQKQSPNNFTSLQIPPGIVCLCLDDPSPQVTSISLGRPKSSCLSYNSHIIANAMIDDDRLHLISFTGSCKVGREVGSRVASRFGKVILELGGNNASIVEADADLDLAVKGSLFAAIGTCGQRCTTLRRLMINSYVYDKVLSRLVSAYDKIAIGSPLNSDVHCGPLHSAQSTKAFFDALLEIREAGGRILCGGELLQGNYVSPAIVEVTEQNRDSMKSVYREEVFGPILYVFKVMTLEEAIELNNEVDQGLSSSLYTANIQNIYKWIGPAGGDCGIVNVNIGPSGAEIGGAFGGEKHTGGGREAGSDSWKQYMRRSTCTINCTSSLQLAQGVQFDIARA